MPFVADDLGAWLVGLLADAGRRKLTTLILGTEQQRALEQAATAATWLVARELRPEGGEQAEELAMVISQVFSDPGDLAGLRAHATLLEGLQAEITVRMACLDDASLTGTEQSSAEILGLQTATLTEKLTGHLMREIVLRGAGGGPLEPLAAQLNHDATHLQGRRLEDMIGQLAGEVQEALRGERQGPTAAEGAAPPDEAFAAERERYLARLVERYRRVDLEVLIPLTEQGGIRTYCSALYSWRKWHEPTHRRWSCRGNSGFGLPRSVRSVKVTCLKPWTRKLLSGYVRLTMNGQRKLSWTW